MAGMKENEYKNVITALESFFKKIDEKLAASGKQYYHEERIADLEKCVFEYSQCGGGPLPREDSLESRIAALEKKIAELKESKIKR
jgi:hypothetical protein